MSDNHIEPFIIVASDAAEQREGTEVLPGHRESHVASSLDRTLGEMNEKMGNMADLIGRLCQSLDTRERQANGQWHNPPDRNGGIAKVKSPADLKNPKMNT